MYVKKEMFVYSLVKKRHCIYAKKRRTDVVFYPTMDMTRDTTR